MAQNANQDGPAMAKTQKTLFLNEELCALIQAWADKTGASFSRVVTAATLQYFFLRLDQPSPEWMKLAVALEKGDTTLAGVPVSRMEDWFNYFERCARQRDAAGEPKATVQDEHDSAKTCQIRAQTWRRNIEAAGGGLAGVIEVVASQHTELERVRAIFPLELGPPSEQEPPKAPDEE